MTVQAVRGAGDGAIRAESDSGHASATLPPLSIMFLDQVDAHAEATVRFSIPSDEMSFLKLAHEYRFARKFITHSAITCVLKKHYRRMLR